MTSLKNLKCLSAFHLKLMAMAFMLCDHLWATAVSGNMWLTNVGRLAFPIFAFQIAEGFCRTDNFKKYLGRMFIFALISELPFNLMYSGSLFFPFHQNVLFTFTLSLICLKILDNAKKKSRGIYILAIVVMIPVVQILGFASFVDYYGFGILTVMLFYIFREGRFAYIGQFVGMVIINWFMMGGMTINFSLFGMSIEFPQQAFALFALIPIWMYNGRRGYDSRVFRIINYSFYPVHMLILAVLTLYILK